MKIPLFSKPRKEAIDPVCHMSVNAEKPNGGSYDYKGNSYYFCAPGCKMAFQKDQSLHTLGKKTLIFLIVLYD